jgi:predicted nucleic acid-binding protein
MIEGPFIVAVVALIAVFGSKVLNNWIHATRGNAASQQKIQELERRLQALESRPPMKALEERVHVLEEIVTTDEFELQQKFRQLEQGEASQAKESSQSGRRPR